MRVEKLCNQYGLEFKLVHYPLHPETPEEGRSLEELFAGRNVDVRASQMHLKTVAEAEGLPFGDRTMTYNSRLAQELGAWADSREAGGAVHDAIFRAYFVDGVNLARVDELVRLAGAVGLPESEARETLEGRLFREHVDRDWQRSRQLGISGVPTLVLSGRVLVGAQPYPALERFVREAERLP